MYGTCEMDFNRATVLVAHSSLAMPLSRCSIAFSGLQAN